MTTSRFWQAMAPVTPVLMVAALYGLVVVLRIQSTAGALAVGIGFGVVWILADLVTGRMGSAPVDQPLFHPRLVPWGAGYVLVGVAGWLSREPWNYWGAGLGALGLLYLVAGSLARRAQSPEPR